MQWGGRSLGAWGGANKRIVTHRKQKRRLANRKIHKSPAGTDLETLARLRTAPSNLIYERKGVVESVFLRVVLQPTLGVGENLSNSH